MYFEWCSQDFLPVTSVCYDITPSIIDPEPLYIKQQDVLPPNLAKFQSREITCYSYHIVLEFYCQISDWSETFKPESHGVETSRDLAVRRPSA